MKIVIFSDSITRSSSNHRERILNTLLEGMADRGHHIVAIEPETDEDEGFTPRGCSIASYTDWSEALDTVEGECKDASAIVVTSGFPPGPEAVEELLGLGVPATVYYELDPWVTLARFDAGEDAPWLRADQLSAFDIVFSIAGGPALDGLRRHGGRDVVELLESIDPAFFHPQQPTDELACDLLLVADYDEQNEALVRSYLMDAAGTLPNDRFLLAGTEWEPDGSWPDNLEVIETPRGVGRSLLYSAARVVLVPIAEDAIEYAMPRELLEPAACAAACAVLDRPGLDRLFVPGVEIMVTTDDDDLAPYLRQVGDTQLIRFGNLAEKRVHEQYTKLRAATKFEQLVARKYYVGHHG